MTTVAIVGAGPGLGAATARRFAAEVAQRPTEEQEALRSSETAKGSEPVTPADTDHPAGTDSATCR
jgi:NAD(P)-dependent dehydrogenase (short-subunit alcohol dehydrogenase family)